MELPEEKVAPLGEPRRLIGAFFEPGAVFADIANNGRWWIPLLIIIVLSSLFMTLFMSRVGVERMIQKTFETNTRMQEMPAAQKEQAIEMQRKIMPLTLRVMPVVGALVMMLVMAAALLFVFKFMLDAPLRYKQVLNICCYANVPPGLVGTAATIMVMYLKSPDEFDIERPLAFNAGAFLNPDTAAKWLQSAASSFDLFTFWTMALLAIGFSAACGARKMPFGRALTGIVLPWLLWVVLKAGFASLFG